MVSIVVHSLIALLGCLITTGTLSLAAALNGESELKLVHVLFRHGERTPDNKNEMFPTDPYLNFDFYPMGLGQLTNLGKNREFTLGKTLRSRYVDETNFLNKVYSPNAVAGHSSDYDRTKMSLQLVLAALFPPAEIQRWNAQLDWQPIPTTYEPRITDNLFLSDDCPLFLAEYERVLNTPMARRQLEEYSDFMETLTELTGKNITTTMDMYYLYHTFMAEDSMGLALPRWAYQIFPYGRLFDGTVLHYRLSNSNNLLKRLYAGPLLRRITDNMKALVNGTFENGKKLYLYSGHETNIAAMLLTLGVYEPHVPEYSSAVIFELHEISGSYYVKLFYYLGIPATVTELRLPGCDTLCPLEDFLNIMKERIPSDEELVCDKTKTANYADEKPDPTAQEVAHNLIETLRMRAKNLETA